MQEFEFIKRCTGFLPRQAEGLACGVGDDCAVIIGSMGRDLLISTDAYSEGIHFCSDWMSAKNIGRRCLIGAMSDIAAMGGRPRYVTIAISVPPTISENSAAEIMEGITSAAFLYQAMVIGGDTIATQHDLQISLTVIGDIRHGGAVYRRGARAGDVVYVTGTLGGAAVGLEALKRTPLLCKEGLGEVAVLPRRKVPGGDKGELVGVETLPHPNSSGPLRGPCVGEGSVSRFLYPEARITTGQWLTETGCVTSMIDISDGLVQDLGHMALASNLGMVLNADEIPRWNDSGVAVDLQTACTSGEEYELAFTVDGRRDYAFKRLLPAVQRQLGHPITRIGVAGVGSGVIVRDATGSDVTPAVGGFSHVIGKGS